MALLTTAITVIAVRRLLHLLALFWPLWLVASAGSASSQIRLGEVNPLTGGVAQFGLSCHNGITLALAEANAKGGALGQPLELIAEDDGSKPGQSATAVRKLIAQDHVIALLGDATSSATLEAGPVAQAAKVPMITPSGTNPRITEIGDQLFRVCFLDEFQGRVIARYARDRLHLQKVAVLTDVKQDYSVDLARFFKEEWIRLGGTVNREQSYGSGDTDFRAQLTSLRAARPDAVYLPGYYAEVALILKQLRQMGMNLPVLGCDGWANQTLLTVAGKAADNSFFTNHFSPDDPSEGVQTFVKAYAQKFGGTPDTFAALGYDAANILVDAIRRAGKPEPGAIRDALAVTKGYPGVTGTIAFDPQRNAAKAALILGIKDGKFEVTDRAAP